MYKENLALNNLQCKIQTKQLLKDGIRRCNTMASILNT